jgi:cytosine/adenosine deaminase-related metal-dependent hydrolase
VTAGAGGAVRVHAGWVLPVSSPPIQSGAVRVRDGMIREVGPASAVEPVADERQIFLPHAALLPGLVNVHAHPELALFRGALEDVSFPDWISGIIRLRWQDPDPARDLLAARWTALEAVRAGITTMGATEASGAAAFAFTEAGLRGVVYQEVFAPDAAGVDEAMADLAAAVERLQGDAGPLVEIGISPHAPYTVCDALYRRAAQWAAERDLPLATHVAESAAESALVARGDGVFADRLRGRGIEVVPRAPSPIRLLEACGVLRPGTLLIHAIRASEEDLAAVAASGAAVAHCPVANARLGHGIAPLPAMLEAGIPVGLGTDSVASNNRLDMLEEARTASLLQRATTGSATLLPAAELLRLCTHGGAEALGLGGRVGTLEPGKEADLCAISLAGPHVRPVHDVEAAVVHAARGSDVVLTMVAGRILYRDGELSTLDVAALERAMEEAGSALLPA